MSRLSTLSPAAIRAMFSPDSDAALITLLTIYDPDTNLPTIRLADNYTQRISETSDEVLYGVVSRGNDFIFLPMQISLPTEEDNTAPKCSIVLNDVTQYLTPTIRGLSGPPKVLLELVLTSTPSVVEASFSGFYISNITYNMDSVNAELSMIDYQTEPFPCFTFTPAYFPGMF